MRSHSGVTPNPITLRVHSRHTQNRGEGQDTDESDESEEESDGFLTLHSESTSLLFDVFVPFCMIVHCSLCQ